MNHVSQCVVLGGGVGTRMRPATNTLPKPLLPVAGEPFAVHQLRWLASEGVTDVVYSIGYLGDMIRDALASRRDLGCSVRFVDEGSQQLGTGGAVRFALDQGVLDETFFVLYGDSYLRVDVSAVADRFEESGDRGPDDGLPQRRPVGSEQRRLRRATGSSVTTSTSPTRTGPACTTSTTVCRSCAPKVFVNDSPAPGRATWPT